MPFDSVAWNRAARTFLGERGCGKVQHDRHVRSRKNVPLCDKETVSGDAYRPVMMKPPPATTFEVPQAECKRLSNPS